MTKERAQKDSPEWRVLKGLGVGAVLFLAFQGLEQKIRGAFSTPWWVTVLLLSGIAVAVIATFFGIRRWTFKPDEDAEEKEEERRRFTSSRES